MEFDRSSSKTGSSASNQHFHPNFEKHGEDRDSGHRYGGIKHRHDKVIDITENQWLPRKHLPNENNR